MAFIDLGDQFIALQAERQQPADDGRHVGLVVDDKEAARAALKAAGVKPIDGPFLDSATPGAIASRSWAMTISSSPRLQTFCAAWACGPAPLSWTGGNLGSSDLM
jgi:hypothetical protein